MANRRKCSIVYKLLMSGELDNACKILEEFDPELLNVFVHQKKYYS